MKTGYARLGPVSYWYLFGLEVQYGRLSGRITVWFRHKKYNIRRPRVR